MPQVFPNLLMGLRPTLDNGIVLNRNKGLHSESLTSGSSHRSIRHRMILNVQPTAEHLVTAIPWPCRLISEPTVQLLNKDVLAQLFQDFVNVVFRITFLDQIDRELSLNSSRVIPPLVGSALGSLSKGCLGLTTTADRFNMTRTAFSRWAPLISVMQSADLLQLNHSSDCGRLNGARNGRVFIQRLLRSMI